MKTFKSKYLKLIFVFLIIQSLQLTPAQAISCKDAKETVANLNMNLNKFQKEFNEIPNKIGPLQTPNTLTKAKAKLQEAECLKFFKNSSGTRSTKSFCDYSKDIGVTTWTCTSKACSALVARQTFLKNQIDNLKYDASKVITNSQKCFSAMEVLNAQKELQNQGRS